MSEAENVKFLKRYNKTIMPRLEELIEPLKILGIDHFDYVKILDDKKCFRIGNHPELNEKFYELKLFDKFNLARWPEATDEKIIPYYRLWSVDGASYSDKIRRELGMGHGICLYRTTKHHKEGWAFCGSKEREDLPNFYINNTDLLLKFIVYFKSMAEDIIDVSDERKLIDITFSEQTAYPKADFHEISTAFKKALEKSRYCLESPKGQFWLTAREIDCLRLKNQGLSAKMIARELDISHRTVESFLDNVKSKSPLSSLNETIKICRQQGLL